MGSGVSKGNKQSNGKQNTVTLVRFNYMENENRSGIKKVNQSNMDIKDTICKSENILNPSSAPEARGESNGNAEKNKILGNTDDTNLSGTSHSDIHIEQHESGYSYTQDDTQKKLSENNENINAKHEEQKKSTHSPTKEDNNSSTTDDMSGHYHKPDSCLSGNTVADVCRTTDDASDITEANLLEGIDETQNQNNDSLPEKSSKRSTSAQTTQQTKGRSSGYDNIESNEGFLDESADMVNVNKSFGEKDKSVESSADTIVDTSTDTTEERTGFTGAGNDKSTAKDNKNENPKLSEYRLNENVQFYRNKLCSKPFPGATVEDMLTWKGDYHKLERTHSYIQWLFPIPESRGMNYSAQPLQEHEAEIISEDEDLRNKVLEAFKMMLDFYGMELDLKTESVKRTDNWEERYENLNRSTHNHFRITRIIKSIGELGWKTLQVPWIQFMMNEAIINKKLPKLTDKTLSHFIDAIKEEEDKWKQYAFLSDLNSHSRKQDEVKKSTKQQESVNTSNGSDKKFATNDDKISETKASVGTGNCDKVDENGETNEKKGTSDDGYETTGDETTTKQGTSNTFDTNVGSYVESKEIEISKGGDENSKGNGDNASEINKIESNMVEVRHGTRSENANDMHVSTSNKSQPIVETGTKEGDSDEEKHKLSKKDTAVVNEQTASCPKETLQTHDNNKVVIDGNNHNGNDDTANRSENKEVYVEAHMEELINFNKDNHNDGDATAQKGELMKKASKVDETWHNDKQCVQQGDDKKNKLKIDYKQCDHSEDLHKQDVQQGDDVRAGKQKKDGKQGGHTGKGGTTQKGKDNVKKSSTAILEIVSTV